MKRGLLGAWTALLVGMGGVGAGFVVPLGIATEARASVSLAATWDGLLQESTAAAVMTPAETQSVWENGRIYTYTRLTVDRAVAGDLPAGSSVWVRTMGGVVGKIGQMVEGEPVFAPGHASLLFLHPGPAATFEVTARAQGQFPVVIDNPQAPPRLVRSGVAGGLLPRASEPGAQARPRLAADVVHGRAVDDVVREIAADWERAHRR
jgi:hypothetical protein